MTMPSVAMVLLAAGDGRLMVVIGDRGRPRGAQIPAAGTKETHMPKHMTALPSDKVWSLAMALIANGRHHDIRDAIIDAANQVWMISSGAWPGVIREPELASARFVLRGDDVENADLRIEFDIGDVLDSMMPLAIDVYERDDT